MNWRTKTKVSNPCPQQVYVPSVKVNVQTMKIQVITCFRDRPTNLGSSSSYLLGRLKGKKTTASNWFLCNGKVTKELFGTNIKTLKDGVRIGENKNRF